MQLFVELKAKLATCSPVLRVEPIANLHELVSKLAQAFIIVRLDDEVVGGELVQIEC